MPIANIGAVPDVATATSIASDWGNATGSSSRGRVVHRFNTPTERDASITAPTPGMVCYVASTNIFYGYANPGGWTTLNWAGTWHARVYRAAAQNIPTSATPMPCDTVGEDPAGMYSLSTKLFTVPVPGIYLLCGKIEMTATAAGQFVTIQAGRNGTMVAQGTNFYTQGPGPTTAQLAFPVRCVAGDTVAAYVNAFNVVLASTVGALAQWTTLDYLGRG